MNSTIWKIPRSKHSKNQECKTQVDLGGDSRVERQQQWEWIGWQRQNKKREKWVYGGLYKIMLVLYISQRVF